MRQKKTSVAKPRNHAENRNDEPVVHEIIDESPTNNRKSSRSTTSKPKENARDALTQSRIKRRAFKRNKSDSILQSKPGLSNGSSVDVDDISDYFKGSMDFGVLTGGNQSGLVGQSSKNSAAEVENKKLRISDENKQNQQVLDDFFAESIEFSNQIRFSVNDVCSNKSNSIVNIEDSTMQTSACIPSEDLFLDEPIFSQDIEKLDLDFASEMPLVQTPIECRRIKSPSQEMVDVDELSFMFANSDIDKFTLECAAKTGLDKSRSPVPSATPKPVQIESEEMINVEEISFMFANQGLSSDQKSDLESSLLPSKKEVRSVLKTDDNRYESSQKPPMDFAKLNCLPATNEINMSKCSDRLLKWSASSGSEEAPLEKSKHIQVAKKQTLQIKKNESLKDISSWNLPSGILREYHSKGIHQMFDWQVECLSNPKVLFDHANLVYSAPTSAGKTLVSEMLTIKTVIERKKKALIILPFISVVREKMCYLQDLLTSSGYRVDGFFGGYTPPGGFENINIAICTIEKANSIVNKLLEQQKLEEIGIIVVDEIHLISDSGRGYILELLLAKVIYICRKYFLKIQIVAMSATLSNIILLQKWLQAEFYVTDFRPVELQEMIKIGSKIYDNKMKLIRELKFDEFKDIVKDQDNIGQLCIETILADCSVIVFCPSKDWCESLCLHLASSIVNVGRAKTLLGEKVRLQIKKAELEEIKMQLKNCPAGLDSVLEKTVSYACAFHHAGLTTEERDIVESSFKSGSVKVLVATSTLSSGVNLPARRVIIRSPLFAGKKMNPLTYKQMIGRAGRTGKDTLGESILICTDVNAKTGKELVCSELLPIASCLNFESSMPLKRALLEVISSGVATTKSDVTNYLECTLLHIEKLHSSQLNEREQLKANSGSDEEESSDPLAESLQFLIEYEFVRHQMNEELKEMNYVATRLGMACLSSSLPPNDGLLLFSELQKSRRCFVLESDLHAVYLVTPYSVCFQFHELDWLQYLDMFEKLSPAMKRVAELVGVKESFLVRAMRNTKLDFKALQVHKRFYTALALQELVNEVPINNVAVKYKCSRGLLQSLQQMSSTFAGIVTSFCTALNWTLLAVIVSEFKERLFFGVHRDLIDLMRIPDLNGQKARVLFDAGITSLIDLANLDSFVLEKILFNCISFDTEKKREDEDEYEANKRNVMRCLYITGKSGLTIKEAAKLLIANARQYLQHEIGVENVKWTTTEGDDTKKMENEIIESNLYCVEDNACTSVKINKIVTDKPVNQKEKLVKQDTNSAKSTSSRRIQNISSLTPRRSPRNHKISNQSPIEKVVEKIKAKTPKSDSESLFNDSSFNIDSQMANVLDKKRSQNIKSQSKDKCRPDEKTINSPNNRSIEEIAGSQSSKTVTPRSFRCGNNTRQTRSKFSQPAVSRKCSEVKAPEIKNIKQNNSNSIEISDCASSSLLHNPLNLNSSHILSTSKTETTSASFNSISIVDMCGNCELFKKCIEEIVRAAKIGLSVAVQNLTNKRRPLIGANLLINQLADSEEETNIDFIFDDTYYVPGISLSIASNVSYFLNLQNMKNENKLERSERISYLMSLIENENLTLRIFDAKEQLKVLKKILPEFNTIKAKIEDPKIANWLLEPDKELSLSKIVQQYASECSGLMGLAGICRTNLSIGLNHSSAILGRVRSAIESCVTLHILEGQIENLERISNGNLQKFFHDLEMPIQCSLWKMESIGFPVDESNLGNLSKNILEILKKIERKIYELHGSRFNLTSTSAVARVLGLHKKSSGRHSTAKQILEKIDSPISNLILDYRKLGATLNKTIQPLIKSAVNGRIHGNSVTFTATGRISMHEPNLQNVAKDFTVEISGHEPYSISCRSSFACCPGRCLISVDFCQLEMRILTHLSQDSILAPIMRTEEDIFRAISARWNKIPEEAVSEKLRNGTKQICYGIIYGMGIRSLAENLKCNEDEAATLVEQFHSCYPGIRTYTHKVIKFAKQNGYVETITGRRRYLPHITNTDESLKGQAERQALNTTIQGSAADLAKKAILRTERNLEKYAPKIGIDNADVQFVLHLHDELIFEVPEDKVNKAAKILRASMENCAQLNVPLRVKLKAGKSWGQLIEI